MIQASELRIGNLVNFRDEDHVFEITEIHKLGIGVKDSEQETWIEYDCFDPIPLTKEWLVRFGFDSKIIIYYKPDNPSLAIKLWDHEATPNVKYILFWENIVIRDLEVFYVHQLQNLYFALTGEELTIKSEKDESNTEN